MFRLSDLENFADTLILSRAADYVEQGRVSAPSEDGAGIYRAVVSGSDAYDVTVVIDEQSGSLDNPLVTHISCTCPYDRTPMCKHIAAVLLVLREEMDEEEEAERTTAVDTELAELVSALSRDELEEIVLHQAQIDRRFALMLRAEYSSKPTERAAFELRAGIRAELNRFTGSWGLIPYHESFSAAGVLDRYFDQVTADIEHGAFRSAFRVLTAIMEEAAAATQYTDDSGGAFGDAMHTAVHTMKWIAGCEIDDDLRYEMLEYIRQIDRSDSFVDPADLRFELWDIASKVVHTDKEYQDLRATLVEAIPSENTGSFFHDHGRERLLGMLVGLMERFGDVAEAEDLRWNNRHLPLFRTQLLEQAWELENYSEVAKLAEDGIACDERLRGLVAKWRDWALHAYRAAGDDRQACRIARELVLAGDAEYLPVLNELVPRDRWSAVREELIEEMQRSDRRAETVVPELLLFDGLWDRLMQFVERHEHLVTEYGQRLFAHFPERVRTVWERRLREEARATSDRSGYRRLARSIREYRQVAGKASAHDLRDRILEEFPRRPAMRDELSRV